MPSGSGELLVDRGEAVLHTVHIHRVGPYQVIRNNNKNKKIIKNFKKYYRMEKKHLHKNMEYRLVRIWKSLI